MLSKMSTLSQLSNKFFPNEHDIVEWRECFTKSCKATLDPCYERLNSLIKKNETSQFFTLAINNVEGSFTKLTDLEGDLKAQLRMSLFDLRYKKFYGRTWSGPIVKLNQKKGKIKLDNKERLLFQTPIRDHDIVIAVELLCLKNDMKPLSLGWTVFRPFNLIDTKTVSKKDANFRAGFYHGTPRALLFLDDLFEDNAFLKAIDGCYLNYGFKKTKLPERFHWLVPENVIVSAADRIGGIDVVPRDHAIESIKLISSKSVVIDDLSIQLFPNVAKFENELCALYAADKSDWNKVLIDPTLVNITERRLKICVHNGFDYVNEPHIVHLRVDNKLTRSHSSYTVNKRLCNVRSPIPLDDKPDEIDSPTRLTMRNSVVLNDLYEDPTCCIVFAVEYVINVPVILNPNNTNNTNNNSNSKTRASTENKKQFETHYVIARWAAWSPFTNINRDTEYRVDLNLFGGSKPINPEKLLVYKVPDTKMQDELSSKHAPGRIGFIYQQGNQVKDRLDADDFPTRTDMDYSSGNSLNMYDKSSAENPKGKSLLMEKLQSMTANHSLSVPRQVDRQYNEAQRRSTVQNRMQAKNTQFESFDHDVTSVGGSGGSIDLHPINMNPYPLLALEPGQIGGRTISRASYAKLHAAKFPLILDRFGKPPQVVDENSPITFDLHTEENDILACNEISLQFLALSRTSLTEHNLKAIGSQSVVFTYQFYRFPEMKTPRLVMDCLIDEYASDLYSTPFVLKHMDSSSGSLVEKPGFMIKYNVDPSSLINSDKKDFLQYLAYQTLSIDVWDGNTLHLIGTCTLELKQLLRHGKEAVQSTYELDVLSTEYDDEMTTGHHSGYTARDGLPYPSNSHICLQGKLHLRVANTGSPMNDLHKSELLNGKSGIPSIPKSRVITSKTTKNQLEENMLLRKFDETSSNGFLTHSFSKANHMTDKFQEIHKALVTDTTSTSKSFANDLPSDPLKKRKLNRMEQLRKLEQNDEDIAEPLLLMNTHKRLIDDRKKELKLMEFYRKQSKTEQIRNKLQDFITTECRLYPSFGNVEFFEYVITNPFSEPQTISISSTDQELQVVTDHREWRNLKILNQMYSDTEDMFNRKGSNRKSNESNPQVFLRPKETVHIPFKYQTFNVDNFADECNTTLDLNLHVDRISGRKTKTCQVTFQSQDGNPIAVLKVYIEPQWHIINQTFRFNVAEHTFLKKTIRLPSSTNLQSALALSLISRGPAKLDNNNGTNKNLDTVFVRCSDRNVICDSKPVPLNEPRDIFVKVQSLAAPSVKKVYLAIFADQHCSILLQIWQLCVHSLQRVDISCIQGQTTRFSVILKGLKSPRNVKAYPNAHDEMVVAPKEQFKLAADAVQELNIGLRLLKSGTKFYYLNVVDTESFRLVYSWFVYVHSKPPVISKAFELTLPAYTGGNASNYTLKRVQYTNPYASEKVFMISTSHEHLLSFKETRMRFMPNEVKTLGLKFLPNLKPGFVEILVFINNENDTNEETFAIRGTFVNSME